MPSYSGGPGAPAVPATRPPAMDMAVRLMQLGGLLSLIGVALTFATKGQIEDEVTKQMREAKPDVTQSSIDAAITFGLVFAVVLGLLGVALWFWMASANGKGKSWARIVATVFFVLSLISFLLSFAQAAPLLSRMLSIVSILVGAAAVFLMYKKESSAFYAASSGRM
ncbi:MAG: hypothetical protein V9G19_24190 [Tetrasphaera sp.]